MADYILPTAAAPTTNGNSAGHFDLQAEILSLLQSIVAESGPNALSQLTRKMVRDSLEAKLGYSLAQYKDQIKTDLAAVLDSHPELWQPLQSAPAAPAQSVATHNDETIARQLQAQEQQAAAKPPRRAAAPAAKKTTRKRKAASPEDPDNPKPKRAKSTTGINAPLNVSPTLATVLGSADPISRPQIVKRLWEYIKANQLQDPADGRFILCDPLLLKLFGSKRVSAFGMQKLLSDHVTKIEGPAPGATVVEVEGPGATDGEQGHIGAASGLV